MTGERTDEELVKTAQDSPSGDFRAVEALILRHQGKVVANCRYLTRSPADSEDLAQEVFVKAFFALRRFEGRSRFSTWLHRIKVNHCLNFLKKEERRKIVDTGDEDLEESPRVVVEPMAERAVAAGGDRARIRQVLDSLSDKLRVPLVLRDLDGLSYQEIAGFLNLGLSAVKMRIKRARQEFRQRFEALSDPGAGSR